MLYISLWSCIWKDTCVPESMFLSFKLILRMILYIIKYNYFYKKKKKEWWGRGWDTWDLWQEVRSSEGEEKILGNLWATGWTHEKREISLFMKGGAGRNVQLVVKLKMSVGYAGRLPNGQWHKMLKYRLLRRGQKWWYLLKYCFLGSESCFFDYSLTGNYKLHMSTLVMISRLSGMMMLYHYLFKFVFPLA